MKTAKQLLEEATRDEEIITTGHFELYTFSDTSIIRLMEEYAAIRYREGIMDGRRNGIEEMKSNFRDLLGIENTQE